MNESYCQHKAELRESRLRFTASYRYFGTDVTNATLVFVAFVLLWRLCPSLNISVNLPSHPRSDY